MIMKGDPKAWKALGAGSCAIIAHLNKETPPCGSQMTPPLFDLFILVLDQGSNTVTVSNLGDSRCVLGSTRPDSGFLEAIEMSVDHSATTDKERLRVRMEHPNDPSAISERWDDYVEEYAWFVKNRARFTRSIGDSCMKDKECAEFYNANIPRGPPKMLPLPSPKPPRRPPGRSRPRSLVMVRGLQLDATSLRQRMSGRTSRL